MAHWALFFIPGASAGKIRRRRGNPNPNNPAAGILSGAGQGKLIYVSFRSSSKLLAWEWELGVFPAFGILRCQTLEGGCAQLFPDLRLLLDLPELEWVLAGCKSIPSLPSPSIPGVVSLLSPWLSFSSRFSQNPLGSRNVQLLQKCSRPAKLSLSP